MQGFSLTLGSDIAFLVNAKFREQRDEMASDIAWIVSLIGTYTTINTTGLISPLNGIFLLNQLVLPDEPLVKYHYVMEGCYRDPSWSIVFQAFTWPWLFAFAPLFVLCLALKSQIMTGPFDGQKLCLSRDQLQCLLDFCDRSERITRAFDE